MKNKYFVQLYRKIISYAECNPRYRKLGVNFISNGLLLVIGLYLVNFLVFPFSNAVIYTYGIFYKTTSQCFPNHTDIAFAVFILIPQAVLLLVLLTYIPLNAHRVLSAIIRKIAGKILGKPPADINEFLQFIREKLYDYDRELTRQIIIGCFITGVFCVGYYVMSIIIQNKEDFFHAQLILSKVLLLTLGLQFITILVACRTQIPDFFKKFLSENGSAYNLAILRIIICHQLIHIYQYDNSFWASLPHQMRVDLPFMGWFIQNIPISPEIYNVVTKIGLVCAFMATFGLFTRLALLINIPLSLYIMGVPLFYGKLFHTQIWFWFPAILAFSQCGDVLSVDYLIRRFIAKKTIAETRHPRYAVPIRIIWLHLGIIYLFAGIGKLKESGLAWALSDSMINQIQIEWIQNYNQLPFFRIDKYPLIAHFGGLLVIMFEMIYSLLIFSAFGRIIAGAGGLIMHQTIARFMYISFGDLQQTYISYVNWPKIVGWVKKPLTIKPLFQYENSGFSFKELLGDSSFKAVLIVGLSFYSVNFIFGVFRIHSWPFSSYPTYSQAVPATNNYVYFIPYTKTGDSLNIYRLGKEANYRMEDFTPIEDRIYENVQVNDTVTRNTNIMKLWSIWKNNVKPLRVSDTVFVYLRKSPVAPETKDSLLENKLIYVFKNK